MDEKFNKAEWDFFVTALKEEARTILKDVGSRTGSGDSRTGDPW